MPLVSIVVLNWRSYPVVVDAVDSAFAQVGVDVEVLVVDNGSDDDSLPVLRQRFPSARFIALGTNTGFTGGMNAGTAAARGEFVVWQNADLVLSSDYCARALDIATSHPRVGAIGGRVLRLVNGARTNGFDAAGYLLAPTHRVAFVRGDHPRPVVGVSGSCPFFRRSALRDLERICGYVLDPWYFTYGEDIDVMLRLHLAGWDVWYDPSLTAWHVRSGSTQAASRFYDKPPVTFRHYLKNRAATVIKSVPTRALWRRLPFFVAAEVALPGFLAVTRPARIPDWARAWREVWRERRRLLHDRRLIQGEASPASRGSLVHLLQEKP